MINFLKQHPLILMLPLAFFLYNLAFENTAIFWYMYTFAMLILMSLAIIFVKIYDELVTWKSLVYGLGYGTLLYGIIAAGFQLLLLSPFNISGPVDSFLSAFAPVSIWHYLLLMFIIVPGEEIFWRGLVQQKLKQYVSTPLSVLSSAILFGLALALSGFWPGVVAGIAAGLILGLLYEWKRSLPVIIVAHLIMIVLLFLILPLPV
ncbi:CAAX amino terminal protease [Planococcus antarcticus DSM 14505]|uniref:CAAX amino terminal protease n=1 Tax=Planococcus antarcticus DSM 14505 TaxID=1185653 RepID=A0A1C7DG45_9BACL|nr:CPBP family intramembrane glutamic endopeptidase [Planococcus antarcticus]ANU10388.1 CAAX protease family protein [Planococcus antarcticus DSM 14505]EIM05604.1 CAAX amino terminal protease [Planococcus antarcticus DSM 14505]